MRKSRWIAVNSSWKNVVAAGPLLFLAAVYGKALLQAEPSIPPLARILRIEAYAIHSLPFVLWIALPRPKRLWVKLLQWAGVIGLMGVSVAVALASAWESVLLFVSLTAATYVGFLLNLHSEQKQRLLVSRWLVMFMLLILLGIATDLPENIASWGRSSSTLYMGFFYFGILGALEAIGFYQARVETTP